MGKAVSLILIGVVCVFVNCWNFQESASVDMSEDASMPDLAQRMNLPIEVDMSTGGDGRDLAGMDMIMNNLCSAAGNQKLGLCSFDCDPNCNVVTKAQDKLTIGVTSALSKCTCAYLMTNIPPQGEQLQNLMAQYLVEAVLSCNKIRIYYYNSGTKDEMEFFSDYGPRAAVYEWGSTPYYKDNAKEYDSLKVEISSTCLSGNSVIGANFTVLDLFVHDFALGENAVLFPPKRN
jgi:hypothetical protein